MTVNVALLTDDAIVFGCDSIASVTTPLLDPFSPALSIKKSKTDPSKLTLEFETSSIQSYVTNTWSGVTKLFTIHDGNTPVAAITAGLARLNGKTMEQLAHEFLQHTKKRKSSYIKVSTVANGFLRFLRSEFEENYANSPMNKDYWQGPEFLVGGYGRDASSPALLKIDVKENSVTEVYKVGETGAAWNGQSTAVQRFIRGYDWSFQYSIQQQHEKELKAAHSQMTTKMIEIIAELVEKTGVALPPDLNVDLSLPKPNNLDMSDSHTNIAYASLPLQSAIDLVSHLVNIQSSYSRFESGIPTVGGRILIGIITKSKGLRILGEPELVHNHFGE